jgi:hypothetical protein
VEDGIELQLASKRGRGEEESGQRGRTLEAAGWNDLTKRKEHPQRRESLQSLELRSDDFTP